MDKATAEKMVDEFAARMRRYIAESQNPDTDYEYEDAARRNMEQAAEEIVSALTQPPVVKDFLTTAQIIDGLQALGPMEDTPPEPRITDPKPQEEVIKAAFTEGVAVYELGPCDGKPMSEDQIEKCWDLSDAKAAARVPQADPRPQGEAREPEARELLRRAYNLIVAGILTEEGGDPDAGIIWINDVDAFISRPVAARVPPEAPKPLTSEQLAEKHGIKVKPNQGEVDFITGKNFGESLHDIPVIPSKPADPLHNKLAKWPDGWSKNAWWVMFDDDGFAITVTNNPMAKDKKMWCRGVIATEFAEGVAVNRDDLPKIGTWQLKTDPGTPFKKRGASEAQGKGNNAPN